MSYGHPGKVEGSQFPWERCSSLAAYTHSEDSGKEEGHHFERWGLCSSQKSSLGSAKAGVRTGPRCQSFSDGWTVCRRPVFEHTAALQQAFCLPPLSGGCRYGVGLQCWFVLIEETHRPKPLPANSWRLREGGRDLEGLSPMSSFSLERRW